MAMQTRATIILCALLTVMLCIPSFLRIPVLLPFTDATVRTAAVQAVEELRTQGWWMVHAHLTDIQKKDESVCFDWIYRYRSGFDAAEPRTERICIPTQS